MPDTGLLVGAILLITASATLQGTTGFGFNILAVPVLALFIEPQVVVPVIVLLSVLLNCLVLGTSLPYLNLGRIRLLLLACVAGTPVGVVLLSTFDPGPVRLVIGLVVLMTGLIMLAGWRRPLSDERLASGLAGSLGGAMNGFIGMAGPPVIFLFANQGMAPAEFRTNIVAYFLLTSCVALGAFALNGSLTGEVLGLTAVTIPGTVLGVLLGIRLHHRVSLALFHRLSLLLVTIAGVTALIAGGIDVAGGA